MLLGIKAGFFSCSKIYEGAVRGLVPVDSPMPVKFPLPDPSNQFSLKPGRVSALTHDLKATEVDKSSTLSLAIAGARAAAVQFAKKDYNSQSIDRNNHPIKINANHDETPAARSDYLRPHQRSMEKDNLQSTELNEKFDDGFVSLDQEAKGSSKVNEGGSSYHQLPHADRRQHFHPSTKVSSHLPYILAVVPYLLQNNTNLLLLIAVVVQYNRCYPFFV